MPTSEVTIACGVLVGRKPDAFSDRASALRCIFAAERATPAGVPAHELLIPTRGPMAPTSHSIWVTSPASCLAEILMLDAFAQLDPEG
jgi:hypothetical protein